jgi:GntR family transcriptional regulator
MLFRPNPGSGVPIYLQLMEQVRHAVETGALRPGEQLPGIRKVAEELVINPNTVAKAYRELEHEGMVELRQGAGAFIAENGAGKVQMDRMKKAAPVVEAAIQKLAAMGLNEEEIRRLFESRLTQRRGQ